MDLFLELNKISNLLMIGISVLVQIIIYPSFKDFEFKNFNKFHLSYSKKMLYIVAPIMLTEIFSSIFLIIKVQSVPILISTIVLFLIWVITFLYIVPIHNHLSLHHDNIKIKSLIKLNAFRTFFWIFKYLIISLC